jgi:hypothetical protein
MGQSSRSFDSLKEMGNTFFKETMQDDSLSPVLYQGRMCQALQFYNKAASVACDAKERSSILKNIAATQFRIGERLYRQLQHQQLYTSKLDSTFQLEKDLKFYLKGSLEAFVRAFEVGTTVQNADWISQLIESQQRCAQLMWNFILISQEHEMLSIILGRLHRLCCNVIRLTQPVLFLKLGRLTFQKAIEHQENGRFIESLQLLRDNCRNIEEAKKDKYLLKEAIELEESNLIHLSIGESNSKRKRGDELWRKVMLEPDNIQMDLVWDAIDFYDQSIVLSKNKSLESEAIAHSHLGRVYEFLKFYEKCHVHYKFTVDLVVAMQPKNFNNHSWYKQALAGLHKLKHKLQQQRQYREREEKERIRVEMKGVLVALKKASERSAQTLIDFI